MKTRLSALVILVFLGVGQAATQEAPVEPQQDPGPLPVYGESAVLPARAPVYLLRSDIIPGTVRVRNTYRADEPWTFTYREGKDYAVNYSKGYLVRAQRSDIPDYSESPFSGLESFDHRQTLHKQNSEYFIYVDYQTRLGAPLQLDKDVSAQVTRAAAKLRQGGAFTLVAYGGRVMAGAGASSPETCFVTHYVDYLRQRFPDADIKLVNAASGGLDSTTALEQLDGKVLTHKPDLVMIGLGRLELLPSGLPVAQFKENIENMTRRVQQSGADVILCSLCPPNPVWTLDAGRAKELAQTTALTAQATGAAYAPIYEVWTNALTRKEPHDLLSNFITNPNDFGHWLHFVALRSLTF